MLEALLRTVHHRLTGKDAEINRLARLRLNRTVRETRMNAGDKEIRVVAVSSMADALNILNDVKAGRSEYHIIEILACQGGCIRGGGQMIPPEENDIRTRIKSVYDADTRESINAAHKNPQVIKIYSTFLDKPMSSKSCRFLHTTFSPQEIL
jgi:iron only hydrogenase large subunit-like protein